MGKIQLLDCTLRDGGYINDWNFGEKNIIEMLNLLEESKVDILEVGFFKDEPYKKDRTVYNDAKQLEKQICPKKQGISYAAMVEVLNPLPAEKIAPCSEKTVDIIRVIVWKRLMNEGLEYCRRMIEKGYMVSVQPARVDQYSQEEFIDMIQLFNTISPWAFYVVDSWGNLNAEQLLVYMDLADQRLNTDILLGYHGHNNLMQAYGAAEQMICRNYGRDIVIDASVYGIGRGAGNLNTEVIAKHLNEHCGKNYNLSTYTEVYQGYIKDIYQQEPWGYSTAYYLTALYGCNPNYASYYDLTLHLPNDEIEAIFKLLSEEDKIIYTKEKADKYLRECRRHAFKMAVIIPTKNRLNDNCFYIQKVKDYFYDYNVDLIFYDGSDNNDLEQYIAQLDNPNILYDRYVETVKDDLTIDYKIYSAAQKYAEQYDYVWFCRERSIVHLENIYYALCKDAKEKRDFAIIYPYSVGTDYRGYEVYDNVNTLAGDLLGEIALVGSMVLSGKLLKALTKEYPIDPVTNYGLWSVIPAFHYIAKHPFSVSYHACNALEYLPGHDIALEIEYESLLWLFGERWKDLIYSLPEVYNEVKEKIFSFQTWASNPLAVKNLLVSRSKGGITLSKVVKLKNKLEINGGINYTKIKLTALLPPSISAALYKNDNSVLSKAMMSIYKLFVSPFINKSKKSDKILPIQSEQTNVPIDGLCGVEGVRFTNKQLGIVVVTKDRKNAINSYITNIKDACISYNIDLIIYDSSENNEIEATVNEHKLNGFENLYYYRYRDKPDSKSLDEKVISAYNDNMQYEYLWVTRDRMVMKLDYLVYDLYKMICSQVDFITIYNQDPYDRNQCGRKRYNNAAEFFDEQFVALTVLGHVIVKSYTIHNIINTVPLDIVKNYTLWQPASFFEYIASNKFEAYSYPGDVFSFHPSAYQKSFWLKMHLWQWAYRFSKIIQSLPDVYSKYKPSVLNQEEEMFHLFSPAWLRIVKVEGGLSIQKINQYREEIKYVTKTPLWIFYAYAIMPIWVLNKVLDCPNSWTALFARKIYDKFKNKYINEDGNWKAVATRL